MSRHGARTASAPSAILCAQLLLLLIASAAPLFARSMINPLQEAMRLSLGWNDERMAILQGPALALPMVIASVPVGLMVDRYSRVRLLVFVSVLALAAALLTACATSFAAMFAARCLVGIAIPASGACLFSLLADLYPAHERGRASIAVVVGQYIGIAGAFALGGVLLSHNEAADGWRRAALWTALPLTVVPCLVLALQEPPRTECVVKNPTTRDTFGELWRYRGELGPLIAGLTLLQVGMQSVFAWAVPVFYRGFALPPARVGLFLAVGFLFSGVIGSISGGILADMAQSRGGPRRTAAVLCALALLAAPMMAFAVIPAITPASLLLGIFLAAVCALEVAGTTLVTVLVPNELRGTSVTLLATSVMVFAIGLGPVLVSYLSTLLGGEAAIGRALAIVGVIASLAGAAVFALARRSIGRSSGAHMDAA